MDKKSPLNLSTLLNSSKVLHPETNMFIQTKDIWEKSERPLILIHWLRRFG